ncbi:DNA-binding protein WhiA [Marinitoga aeolica]|uniref:Probable cell division protein WhiA n=1 Tax=Marinitoga aeolica TaxID=2809031 RepID=A0ABY8PNK6_9BACT|nr:DNA-binding protein WhiA [Marinitoga aeolica]WGS64214.1 DNA-binding protein WhiA [Marinitoga aeolica]
MSVFSEEVKLELVNSKIDYPEIELFGFIKGKGSFVIEEDNHFLKLSISSMNTLKRVYKLSKELFEEWITTYIKIEKRLKLGRMGELYFNLMHAKIIFEERNIDIFSDGVPNYIAKDPYLFGIFLRGLFLSCGSVSITKNYHFEIFSDFTELFAQMIIKNLQNLIGIKANYITKNNKIKIYIKSSKDILNVLELIGAHKSVEKISTIIKVRELKSNVSRTFNFISANATKTAESASKQIENITIILNNIGLDNLPDDLKQIALYRLENESDSLSEMAENLNISKSTLYYKMKKLEKIANDLKRGELP